MVSARLAGVQSREEIRAFVISPWTTSGRRGTVQGPTLEPNVRIGTGAKVLGPVRIGTGAQIGANAVVVNDVPTEATVVGVPARVVAESTGAD